MEIRMSQICSRQWRNSLCLYLYDGGLMEQGRGYYLGHKFVFCVPPRGRLIHG